MAPKRPKRGWHAVKPSAKWGCRGGRNCGSIPRRSYIRWHRAGGYAERRYCVAHAKAKGCPK